MGVSCVDLPTDSTGWCDAVRWFQLGSMVVTRDTYIYIYIYVWITWRAYLQRKFTGSRAGKDHDIFFCAKSLSHHLCFAVHVLLISQLEVSVNGGTPKSSIYRWMFHYKPSSYWGTSIYGNPQFRIFTKTSWLPPNRWTQGVEGEHHCGCWERNDHRSLTRRSCVVMFGCRSHFFELTWTFNYRVG